MDRHVQVQMQSNASFYREGTFCITYEHPLLL